MQSIGRRPGQGASILPNDVEDDIAKRGIGIVPVGAPPAGAQIDFNIALARGAFGELHDGTAEIGPALKIAKARMEYPHWLVVGGLELIA